MKARTKVLLTSIASIAMCASIAVGGTYALFTDSAAVNVAVTSGTVDVEATIDAQTLKTYSRGIEQTSGAFANDATGTTGAVIGTDGVLTLTNITPGDKAEFYINVTNDSNVDIQYRTVAYVTGSLADFLVWTSSVNDWTFVEGGATIDPVKVSVELPESVTYEQLGSVAEYDAKVAFTVEAIQGNGDTGFDYRELTDVWEISTVDGLYKFAQMVDAGTDYAGETIVLTKDLDLANKAWTPIGGLTFDRAGDGKFTEATAFKGTFDGQGYTISNMKLRDEKAAGVGLFALANNATIKNVNIKNVDFLADTTVGAIVAKGTGTTVENCHVSGSINMVADWAYVGGIAGYGYISVSNSSVIADGTGVIKSENRNAVGGIFGWLNEGSQVIDNCKVENLDITGWANVGGLVGYAGYTVTVSNSSVKNVDLVKTRVGGMPSIGVALGGWLYNATKGLTVENNTFENITLSGASKAYNEANSIIFGSEYYGVTGVTCPVVSNNTMTNVTDNRTLYTEVADTAALQLAFDKATGNETIQLKAGVAYDTVYMGRPTKYNDTEMFCETHNFTTKDASEFVAHLAETGYHTTPKYTTTLKNLTIVGAEGATVAGLLTTSGHMYGAGTDYVRDIEYTVGSIYYNTLNMSNITFSNVNFTGKIDINTSDATSVYDGITFTGCSFTTGGTASANGVAIRYYNEANNGNVKNITVENCTFNNCYQGIYVHHVNGVKVTGSTFENLGHNAIAMQGHDSYVDLKTVVINGNKFKNVADRIIRFNNVGADSNITMEGNTAENCGDEDGEVMKATSIEAGITTSIKNNTWNGTVVNPELQDA